MIADGVKPYAVAVAGLLWLASLAAVGGWQHGAGQGAERLRWETRENTQLRNANATIKRLQDEARQKEHEHAGRLAGIAAQLEQEKQRETEKRDRLIADLRAANVRLRDPGAVTVRPGGCSSGETAAGAGERDGGAGSELHGPAAGVLSGEASEFLVRLSSEADEVARQLAQCQAVVRSDRR